MNILAKILQHGFNTAVIIRTLYIKRYIILNFLLKISNKIFDVLKETLH